MDKKKKIFLLVALTQFALTIAAGFVFMAWNAQAVRTGQVPHGVAFSILRGALDVLLFPAKAVAGKWLLEVLHVHRMLFLPAIAVNSLIWGMAAALGVKWSQSPKKSA